MSTETEGSMRLMALLILFFAMHSFASTQSTPDTDFCANSAATIDDQIAACTRAITSGSLPTPVLSATFFDRGDAWRSKGDNDRAVADCSEAIRLDPQNAKFVHNRGMVWRRKGDYDRAIADYNEAIRLNPQDANTFNGRGVAWKFKGDYDRAIADYNEAIRLNPQGSSAFYNRAGAWHDKGDDDRAIADYNEAIRLNSHANDRR